MRGSHSPVIIINQTCAHRNLSEEAPKMRAEGRKSSVSQQTESNRRRKQKKKDINKQVSRHQDCLLRLTKEAEKILPPPLISHVVTFTANSCTLTRKIRTKFTPFTLKLETIVLQFKNVYDY